MEGPTSWRLVFQGHYLSVCIAKKRCLSGAALMESNAGTRKASDPQADAAGSRAQGDSLSGVYPILTKIPGRDREFPAMPWWLGGGGTT